MIYNQKRNAKIRQMILKGKKKNMIEVEWLSKNLIYVDFLISCILKTREGHHVMWKRHKFKDGRSWVAIF